MTAAVIDPAKRAEIEGHLDRIARDEQIRIILAIESGSRAWGHPSPDSDYDVRFFYVRRPDAYLVIEPQRDVVELPIADDLDINGWDLVKALRLIVRSNAVAHEWLVSPVVYRRHAVLAEALLAFAREAANLSAFAYHYDRLARGSFDGIRQAEGDVRLKKYFYALRPAMALMWLRTYGTLPPMDLRSLLAGLDVPVPLRDFITELLARKAVVPEAERVRREPILDAFLDGVLDVKTPTPEPRDTAASVSRANALFAEAVLRD